MTSPSVLEPLEVLSPLLPGAPEYPV